MRFIALVDELKKRAEKYRKSGYLYEEDWAHGIDLAIQKLSQADELREPWHTYRIEEVNHDDDQKKQERFI